MSQATTKIPSISWYQRKDTVVVNISTSVSIPDDFQLSLNQNQCLDFKMPEYACHFNLFSQVSLKSYQNTGRILRILLEKNKPQEDFWNQLTSDKAYNKAHVTVDWQNWQDEDEENEFTNNDGSPFGLDGEDGMAAMQALQGMDWSKFQDQSASGESDGSESSDNSEIEESTGQETVSS